MFNGFFVLVVLRLYSCGNVVYWFVLDIFLGVYIYVYIIYIYHSILWDGWPTWYAWIQQCGRRMTVCDENPVAQLVFFRMFHGLAFISLSMLNFGFLWATSMELFRNQAPSSLHVNRFPCASALESFRPRNEWWQWLQIFVDHEFSVIFQGKEFDNAPFLTQSTGISGFKTTDLIR